MELTSGKLLLFVMVLTRISAFFLVVPVFSWTSIPVRVKVAAVLLLAVFFAMIIPARPPGKELTFLYAFLLVASEATYGLALGVIIGILFSVVKLGGQIIEQEMGFTMAEVLDPMTGEPAQPLGTLLEMIFIVLFLAANGHHLFLSVIHRSYAAFPPGEMPTVAVMTSGIIQAGSTMLAAALRVAAPIMAALLVLLVALSILARIVPEMDIFFNSFPVRIGLGLLMTAVLLPFISGFVNEFADLMNKLLPL